MLEIFLFVIAYILALVGIAGAIIPGIPGPPISFAAILVLHFTKSIELSEQFIGIMALLAFGITLLDYYIPIYGTKKFGGTKYGVLGSTIGLIISLVVLPILGITLGPFGLFGIILGPFLGAYIGELIGNQSSNKAFRSAIGSLLGFLAGTLIKVVYSLVVLGFMIWDSAMIVLN